MTDRITPKQIKKANRQLVYDYVYRERRVSRQDIGDALCLSRPTVTASLAELEADGLVYKSGQQDSEQLGRKAATYSAAAEYRVAIGVELMRHAAEIIAVDLYGQAVRRQLLPLPYENTAHYYQTLCQAILTFIRDGGLAPRQLLGIGFAVPGLVSSDGSCVVYGAILGNTGLSVDVLSGRLPCPCRFLHDAESAALSELWASPELQNAVYVSLSRHLGGAMITDRQVHAGKHGHNATFEHIQVRPEGALCYCGRRGCLETVCSMQALLGDEPPEAFFDAVRSGDPTANDRWQRYLRALGRMLGALHLVRDVDIVLGGHLAPFLIQADIHCLYREIREMSPFGEAEDFIRISKMPSHNITVGAALPYIKAFLSDPLA